MDLFDVKARGFRQPLNSREISHLVRSGQLHRRVRCKPRGETNWRRIGELFPLLDYGMGAYELPPDDSGRATRHLPLALATVLVAAVTAAAAFLFYNRSASNATDVRSAAKSRAHQAAAAAVALARND